MSENPHPHQRWLDPVPKGSERTSNAVWWGVTMLSVPVIIDLPKWSSGGGLAAAATAVAGALRGKSVVDLDTTAVWSPILAIGFGATLWFALTYKVNPDTKRRGALLFAPAFIMAMTIAVLFSGVISDKSMSAFGYRRCQAYDHMSREGNAGVWLTAYVPRTSACP